MYKKPHFPPLETCQGGTFAGKKLRRLRPSDDPKVCGVNWCFAALALHFACYNFCRIHGTLRVTPAIVVGITSDMWMLDELLKEAVLQ